MNDQTVMVALAELPGWLQAAGWGALSASGLLIGAVGGYYASLQHTNIARTMTFAAGVLLAVVAVDLVIDARGAASLHWTVTGLLCGAAVFSSVNWLLSRRGAQHRKRCGERMSAIVSYPFKIHFEMFLLRIMARWPFMHFQ